MKVTWLNALTLVAAVILGAGSAFAEYPERPIRLIVPFAEGGGTDIVARFVGAKLAERLGRQVIIDNRGGAGGVIASDFTAKAPADGYTLLMTTTNHSANPALIKNLPYDSVNDFSMISLLADLPGVLLVHPSDKFNTFQEFIAYAKKNSDLNYGSPGIATFPHLSMVMLISRAGLKMTHVPYKGSAPARIDLISGRIQVYMGGYVSAYPDVKAGKLKLLAVSGSTRADLLPDVPTIAEMGYPGFESTYWSGIVGPKQLPEAIRVRLERTFIEVVKSPEISKRLIDDGQRPLAGTGTELAARIKREIPEYQKIIKEANITPE